MANILALETSTNACSAALLINDSVSEKYQLAAREHSKLILPMIESLLAESELQLSNLNAIAFGCGPGSFTGVRIAAGITQGLAFGTGLPVLPVSSLRALAQTAYEEVKAEKIVAAFDARMQEVYWGLYALDDNGLMKEVIKDSLSKPENIILPKDDEWFRATFYPHAREVARLGHADYLAGKAFSADKALPVYLRSVV
jgi:tRNA threonylcarbamoyladenosine biosynthesis protein TsaB